MEASREMLEVILLLGHWLHSRQSCPEDQYDPDSVADLIARMQDEQKLSEAIYETAKTLTETELGTLIADLGQLKQYIIDAQTAQEVER